MRHEGLQPCKQLLAGRLGGGLARKSCKAAGKSLRLCGICLCLLGAELGTLTGKAGLLEPREWLTWVARLLMKGLRRLLLAGKARKP